MAPERNPRTVIRIGAVVLLLSTIIGYAYLRSKEFLTGPQLTILEPKNGQTVASTSPEVLLKGKAENIAFLTVNGAQVFTDEYGDFGRKLLLPAGLAIITVEAQDKFGRSITREVSLIVK